MKRILYTIIFTLTSIALSGQSDLEIKNWKLLFELRKAVLEEMNYNEGVKLFNQLVKADENINPKAYEYGIIALIKTHQIDKAIELMQISATKNNYSFCHKNYDENFEYSSQILDNKVFKELCPVYDYAINFPTDYSEYRDSIVKYLIIGSNLKPKQKIFIKMGYESYYPESPISEMPLIDRIKLSERKIDSLISKYGYPTIKKVIDPWVEFLVGGSIIHSTTLDRYHYYVDNYSEVMSSKDLAYVIDKIAVKLDKEQTYGTQLVIENGKQKLYKTRDVENLNKRRMKMGLDPIEMYIKDFGM